MWIHKSSCIIILPGQIWVKYFFQPCLWRCCNLLEANCYTTVTFLSASWIFRLLKCIISEAYIEMCVFNSRLLIVDRFTFSKTCWEVSRDKRQFLYGCVLNKTITMRFCTKFSLQLSKQRKYARTVLHSYHCSKKCSWKRVQIPHGKTKHPPEQCNLR